MDKIILREEIRNRSAKILVDFVVSLAQLCEEYDIAKTSFIRSTVDLLREFVSETDLDGLNSQDEDYRSMIANSNPLQIQEGCIGT